MALYLWALPLSYALKAQTEMRWSATAMSVSSDHMCQAFHTLDPQIDVLLVDGVYYGFSGCHRWAYRLPVDCKLRDSHAATTAHAKALLKVS